MSRVFMPEKWVKCQKNGSPFDSLPVFNKGQEETPHYSVASLRKSGHNGVERVVTILRNDWSL